jgi:prefoldin alpha subunit
MSEEENKKKEDFTRQMILLQQYKNQIDELMANIEILEGMVNEYEKTRDTIQGIGNADDRSDILIPIGGGTFAHATLKDRHKVIIGIGGNVIIEKSVDKAVDMLEKRMQNFRNEERKLGELAQKLQMKVEQISNYIQENYGEYIKKKNV